MTKHGLASSAPGCDTSFGSPRYRATGFRIAEGVQRIAGFAIVQWRDAPTLHTHIEEGGSMIDHVYLSVTDIDKSLAFYAEALKPLGWHIFGNYDSASGPEGVPDLYGLGDDVYGKGNAVGSSIWLRQRKPGETGLYLGIVCDTNELVDAAYASAIKAGGIDEGKPADRTYFAPGYYAANVADFDGNRLEFVHKAWNPKRHA
ncbi:VOC family protein [Burkholderia cepacia]|uniref:VOC family protein n=1 Tax=Burkholderia cepacia TaxID=292 RepID=UPI00249F2201|nr:VOC family protein [Burkholderia cepacia]WGY70268.1 VOC family protein [Burkholderia cepacia]